MRITSNMIAAQQMTALQSNIALLQQANERVTTGKRINQASDDPAASMSVMNAGSALRALHRRSLAHAGQVLSLRRQETR